ncbi:MAG: alpha-ketoacid dehydrogenase subunit beta [Candidatus Latescibacteria bacterium]|jgi:2-oxoisovalerate dehydrogenase E1 component|nr:alpha-ketoacid dehydrogenase subunit beta [Candidatus Latescibacterota bacterium]
MTQEILREITFSDATLEALSEEMAGDPSIFVVGEGIGPRGGNFKTTVGLYEKYGALRLCDTPIAERGFVGLCIGAAMAGARPVADFMFVDFILDAMGEIVNQAAKIQYMSSGRLTMPLVLRGCMGAGNSTSTHHSGSYYSMFAHIPGLRVAVPSNPYDAKGLLKTAIRSDDPVVFLEHKLLLNQQGQVPDGEYTVPFGKADIVQPGNDVTVVALSVMVWHAIEAANELTQDDISIEIVDPRTVAPLDVDTILESVRKTGRLLIVEESYGPCGIGSEIAAQVQERGFDDLDAPVYRLNGAHTPVPYSPPLEQDVIPNSETIIEAVRNLLAE